LTFAVPPTIGDHAYKDKIILKAGQSLAIEIPFAGSPQPTAEWKYKGGKLPDARRFKVPVAYLEIWKGGAAKNI
jgi:hypothetical protein